MFGILILIFILTLVNGFFAAAEMSLVSISPSQLHRLKHEKVKHIDTLASITEDSTKYLSTIQVAITFAGFLSSAFAGSSLSGYVISWLSSFGINVSNQAMVIIITVLLSFFTLVFGELVPKRIALAKSVSFALFSAPIVKIVMIVFTPFVWLLTVSTAGVLKLLRIKTKSGDDNITEGDIKEMIVYGHIKGLYPSEESQMLERIFQLDDLTSSMVMTPIQDVVSLYLDDLNIETIEKIINSRFSRIPVFKDKNGAIKGVLVVKDLLLDEHDIEDIDIKSYIRNPLIVDDGITINTLLEQMRDLSLHMAFVVDPSGNTLGIVTMEDIVEEIIGNIYDEHDDLKIKALYKNHLTYILPGSMTLSDVEQKIGTSFFSEEIKHKSVGQFVADTLGYLPKTGERDRLEMPGGYFEVLSVDKKKIKQLRLVVYTQED